MLVFLLYNFGTSHKYGDFYALVTSSDDVEVNISPSTPSERVGRHLTFRLHPTSSAQANTEHRTTVSPQRQRDEMNTMTYVCSYRQ